MAEQIPSGIIVSDVSITNEHRTYITESINGKFSSKDSGVQRFSGTVKLTGDGISGAQALQGFVSRLRGRLEEFELQLGGAFSNPNLSGNPVSNTQVTQAIGSERINIESVTGNISPGQMFNIPNDTKMYTCISSRPSGADGPIDIIPGIRVSLPPNVPLDFTTPKFTVILNSNNTTITHSESGLISSVTLQWVESL